MTSGFLVVDKPTGVTSRDVVDAARRATGIRKAGHTGTLDPLATGIVVVALGKVTRLIRFLQDGDKEYVATAMFGVATDSLDADGEETERRPMSVTFSDLQAVRERFLGRIDQTPPMVSALKKDGERLYDLARQGIEVEREPRPVTIHELEFLDVADGDFPLVTFRVVCGKGTYVRSLADDIARACGGFAHLTALRRTRNGTMDIERAVSWDELDTWADHLVSPADALEFPSVTVDSETAERVRNGVQIDLEPDLAGLVSVCDQDGGLIAVYLAAEGRGRPEVVIPA